MLVAEYIGNEEFRVGEGEPVAPAAGQVQIDVAYVGICGTDLHIKHGDMDRRVSIPGVIGHEMSGVVAAVGDDVTDIHVGDHVTVMPLQWCGECPACRAGHQHVCQNLVFVGIDAAGAMQQRWTVDQSIVVPLPPELALIDAALAEPVAVAVHDVRRARLSPGEKVLVVGGGPIGLLVALVAGTQGADVTVSEINEFRRDTAARLGLRTIDPSSDDVLAEVESWTGGAGVDAAFEVSGVPAGFLAASHSLKVRGRLVVVAIHSNPVPADLFRVFWRELEIVGARVYERVDFEEAVRLLTAGAIPCDELISTVEPVEHVADAFNALESGAGIMKVLIDFGGR